LKNQFRSLDEDEVEFLDSVLESTRAKEEAVKKETSEQLEIFRRQREEADKALLGDPEVATAAATGSGSPIDEESWVTSKKRRRGKDKEMLGGIKLRKTSCAAEDKAKGTVHESISKASDVEEKQASSSPALSAPTQKDNRAQSKTLPTKAQDSKSSTLGLGDYSSDED